jgi:hypothetical protein
MASNKHSDYDEVSKLEESGDLPSGSEARWENGVDHHPKSERLMNFLSRYDFHKCDMYFDWKKGGDGDNGEELMYHLDAFFEMLDEKGEIL